MEERRAPPADFSALEQLGSRAEAPLSCAGTAARTRSRVSECSDRLRPRPRRCPSIWHAARRERVLLGQRPRVDNLRVCRPVSVSNRWLGRADWCLEDGASTLRTVSGLALCPLASKGIPWHLAPDALWGLTRGGDLRRAPHLAGAAFGSASELLAECEVVLDKLKLSKRPAQVAALETIARGADLLYVDRTGGGKSLAFQLPAALAWRAAVLAGVALPPILLLVVPYISLGEHQRAAFEAFLARMFAAEPPRRALASLHHSDRRFHRSDARGSAFRRCPRRGPYEMEMQVAAELAPREQQLPDEL